MKYFLTVSDRYSTSGVADTETAKSEKLTLANLRAALGWSRNQLAHVMNASDRAIVNLGGR